MDASAILSEARRRSGLTLRQLARRARTSHSTIAAYETGTKQPTTATLVRLVGACGFELEAELRPSGPFEDRQQRGRQLLEVLDLADQFPSRRVATITYRFPAR